eukprot:4308859-Prymnesium_polylepis.1
MQIAQQLRRAHQTLDAQLIERRLRCGTKLVGERPAGQAPRAQLAPALLCHALDNRDCALNERHDSRHAGPAEVRHRHGCVAGGAVQHVLDGLTEARRLIAQLEEMLVGGAQLGHMCSNVGTHSA